MNKFNLGLHPVLSDFSGGKGSYFDVFGGSPEKKDKPSNEEPSYKEVEQRQAAQEAADERDAILESSKEATSEIVDDATKAQSALERVDNVFGYGYSSEVLNVIYKRKNDGTLDREKVKQIQGRIAEDVRLGNIWEKNIQEGYKHLLQTLIDNKYFNNPYHKTEEEIRRMYTHEIESQYEKHVWNADDKVFGETKSKLFGQGMPDYPANLIYEKLNNTEIFAREVGNKQAYTVEAHIDNDNIERNLSTVKAQDWGDKRRFLSRDLPNYLWETKDTSVFSKILQWTPIISKSNDRKSEEDKRGIRDFIDAVSKISVGGSQKPELALLEAFKDAQSNWTDYQWQEELAANDIYVQTERDMRKIIEAGRFYVKSQRVDASVEDQHNLYLSILGVIEHEGGVNEAIAQFMDDVNEYKENKRIESRKQNEADGKVLEQSDAVLFGIADKFNKRYTRALNLSNMDENSFNRSAIDILADLNNDGTLTYSDRGATKTGFEFKRIANMVGEQNAINHLIQQAKLMNQTMDLGLTEDDLKYEEIKNGNKKLILVLQNIISQPGGDLYPLLMYGTDSAQKYKEAFNRLPESKDDPAVQAATDELLKDIKIEDLQEIQGVENPTDREGVRQAVAGRLFAEYTRGVGLGGTLSFDEWVKGVSLNGGFQVSESGASVGLTLAYNPQIDLGKGWTFTPGASFGFVPLFNTSVGGSAELAKQWIDNNSIAHRIGLKVGFTEVIGIAHVYSASLGRSRDKLAGIEGDRRNIESQFNNQIMSPLMNSIANKLGDNKVLNLEDETVRSAVKDAISAQVESVLNSEEKSKLKQGDKENLIDNTMRFLSFFDKADLSNESVRNAIAAKMAEQYSYAREDDRLNAIDGKTYLSGARLGFSWVQLGALGVGVIHAGLSFTKHEHDIYGDRLFGRHTTSSENFKSYSSWNKDMIDEFNQNLSEDKKLSLNPDGYVVIPKNLFRDAFINPGMKGLIKKDESGNILLHPETRIDLPIVTAGGATESVRFNIGGFTNGMVRLRDITDDRFTDSIDASKLTGKENIFTKESLDAQLNELRANYPEDQDLKNYSFDDSILAQLENGKKYRIILTKNGSGISTKVEETTEGKGLTIEYKPLDKVPLISEEAQRVADSVYAQALKVTSNALYNISHDRNNRFNSKYKTFANAVKDQNYEEAKATILAMLPKMKDYINQYQQKNNQVDFSDAVGRLKNLQGAELGKALMSINNVFARVSSVHGGTDGEYHFKRYDSVNHRLLDRYMGSIIESRAKEISGKIDRSDLDDGAKTAYKNLINFAEKYRNEHADLYSDSKKEAKTLYNAIGINLGNTINIENPLFNPEVYADSVIDSKDLAFEGADVLKGRALNVIAGNRALMSPVLASLGFDENAVIDVENAKYENGQLKLDINGKNVILNADMKFAYFAQCVNHMLILDSISAEIPGESRKVEFGPSVMGNGSLDEGTIGNMFTSGRISGDVAVTAFTKSQDEKPKPDGDSQPGEIEEPINDGDSQPGEKEEDIPDGNSNPGQTPGEGTGGTPEVGGGGDSGSQGSGDTLTGETNGGGNNGGETNGGGSNGGQEGGNNDTTPVAGEGQGGSQSGGMDR